VAYTSASLALASLELFVHLKPDDRPADLVSAAADIPDDVTSTQIEPKDLPGDWRKYPAPLELQEVGRSWIRAGKSAVLRVPSVVVPDEYNYLINPSHPDFRRIVIHSVRPFELDERIWKMP
jgi:RES domain-containing protein